MEREREFVSFLLLVGKCMRANLRRREEEWRNGGCQLKCNLLRGAKVEKILRSENGKSEMGKL